MPDIIKEIVRVTDVMYELKVKINFNHELIMMECARIKY